MSCLVFTFFLIMSTVATASSSRCEDLFQFEPVPVFSSLKTQLLFKKVGLETMDPEELAEYVKLKALWAERDRIRDQSTWTEPQLIELTNLLGEDPLGEDKNFPVKQYKKILDLQESYVLPNFSFLLGLRIEEAASRLNSSTFTFHGETIDLKFQFHSNNKPILERFILETRMTDFSLDQIATLLWAFKTYSKAKEKNGDKEALSVAKKSILNMVRLYFPTDVLPDIASILRVILVKGFATGNGCCGHGCSTCSVYPVRRGLRILTRADIRNTELPLVRILGSN